MEVAAPITGLFIDIGGEFVLEVEGATEKAISHWLCSMLAAARRIRILGSVLNNPGRIPTIFVD